MVRVEPDIREQKWRGHGRGGTQPPGCLAYFGLTEQGHADAEKALGLLSCTSNGDTKDSLLSQEQRRGRSVRASRGWELIASSFDLHRRTLHCVFPSSMLAKHMAPNQLVSAASGVQSAWHMSTPAEGPLGAPSGSNVCANAICPAELLYKND